MTCGFLTGGVPIGGAMLSGDAHAQGLPLDPAGGDTLSPEVFSGQMRQLLPLIMKQLQSNPGLMSQFGLNGVSGLGGLNVGDEAGVSGNAAAIPGLSEAIAKELAKQNAKAATGENGGVVPAPRPDIPEQVQIYREQYHPIDIDLDGRISADEAASYGSWMFRRRDINGDNVLVAREFAAVEKLPGTSEANRQRLRTESRRLELLFPAFDANDDKMISKEEFLARAKRQFDEKRGTEKDLDPFDFQTVLPF